MLVGGAGKWPVGAQGEVACGIEVLARRLESCQVVDVFKYRIVILLAAIMLWCTRGPPEVRIESITQTHRVIGFRAC